MSFEKIVKINSEIVPLPIDNVDTDQIIPARFLKAVTRDGFGENLFRDWRYDSKNQPIENFILNKTLPNCEILLTGKNFGCGSSREHAAWAIYDYGFRVVVSSSFADIFKNNAFNIGLLPIEVTDDFIKYVFDLYAVNKATRLLVNLEDQSIEIADTTKKENFIISAYKKECLLNGYDNIDYLLSKKEIIEKYEERVI